MVGAKMLWLRKGAMPMDDYTLDRVIDKGFLLAMVLFVAVIAIQVAHYLATTNAPWV
jgi:hypothetical protein